MKGNVDGQIVALGNRRLMEDLDLDASALTPRADELRARGQTIMFVAVDGKIGGFLGVADPIKDTTPDAIRELHEDGIRIVMLTGDNQTTANAVGRRLGIDWSSRRSYQTKRPTP